jgi:hypothetical protein
MMISQPDYPHIVLSFTYRGWKIELDQGELDGQTIYAVWASNDIGCAVAVPYAPSRGIAIQRAKCWVDHRLGSADR